MDDLYKIAKKNPDVLVQVMPIFKELVVVNAARRNLPMICDGFYSL